MHELAHIALHVDGSEVWFIDDLDATGGDDKEQQADALAQEVLLPAEVYRQLAGYDPESVRQLAQKLNISPCIIAGRLRHESGNHRLFGTLFRGKVKSVLSCE